MKVFKTKWFERFARKQLITDAALCDAVKRAIKGTIDADLGGGVIKQRVARAGQGRSRGFRVIVLYRASSRSVFVFGFAKSGKADLDDDELEIYRRLAGHYLGASDTEFAKLVKVDALTEVLCDGDQEVS